MDGNIITDDETALDSKMAYAAKVAANTLLADLHENEIRLLARSGLLSRLERTFRELQKKNNTALAGSTDDAVHIRDVILHAVGSAGRAGMSMDDLIEGVLIAVAMLAINGMIEDPSTDGVRQYGEDLCGVLMKHIAAAHKLRDHLPAQLATFGIGPVITAEVDAPVSAAASDRIAMAAGGHF